MTMLILMLDFQAIRLTFAMHIKVSIKMLTKPQKFLQKLFYNFNTGYPRLVRFQLVRFFKQCTSL